LRFWINAGLIISNEEGRCWFERKYEIKLAEHHRQDSNIPLCLNRIIQDAGITIGCCFAPRRNESAVSDFLVITQMQRGEWMNDGPENYEEVFNKEWQQHPSTCEEEAKQWLEKELGLWAPFLRRMVC
jgi:hypothetical protein